MNPDPDPIIEWLAVGLKSDGTDDGTPGGRYTTGHWPVVVYVRRTHDGTLALGVVQASGQTMRHVALPVVMWFFITFLT